MLLFRRGQLKESEKYFRKALERMTWKNPNPYNSEAYYDLGLTLFYQGRYEEAYDAFFKATWTNEQQEMSFYFLAAIASMKKDYLSALELVEKGLVKNSHNIKAREMCIRDSIQSVSSIIRIRGKRQSNIFKFFCGICISDGTNRSADGIKRYLERIFAGER